MLPAVGTLSWSVSLRSAPQPSHDTAEVGRLRELADGVDERVDGGLRQREARVAAEFRLELVARQGRIRAAARVVLMGVQRSSVGEPHADVADELPRVIDGGVEIV